MGIVMRFNLNTERVERRFRRMLGALRGSFARAIEDVISQHNRRWARRFRPFPGPKGSLGSHPADAVYHRSGELLRSYTRTPVQARAGKLTARAFLTARHALAQEFGTRSLPGGAIRPRNKEYLLVPLPAALTPSGRPRFDRIRRGSSGWETPTGKETWISETKGGQPIMFMRDRRTGRKKGQQGGGAGGRPIFLLRKRVEYPGRLGFFDTWERITQFRRLRFRAALAGVVRR